jgi:HNH endonuclease
VSCSAAGMIAVHHVRPLHFGGELDRLWNLLSLCGPCHVAEDQGAYRWWDWYRGVHHWDVSELVRPRRPQLSARAVNRLLRLAEEKRAQALELRGTGAPLAVVASALDYPRPDFLRDCLAIVWEPYELVIRSFRSPADVDLLLRAQARRAGGCRPLKLKRASDVRRC